MALGHGAFISPDAHAAALGAAACYLFWRWLREPTWTQTIGSGLVLGLAESAKTTLILLTLLWPLAWLLYRWPERRSMAWQDWSREAAMVITRLVIGLNTLNAMYLGDGSFTPLKEYRFCSSMLSGLDEYEFAGGNRFETSWLGEIPVPLPRDYVVGIDQQQADFERFGEMSYLRGQFRESGWWWFYLYALLVKQPLGVLALVVLVVAMTASEAMWRRGPLETQKTRSMSARDEWVLLAPALLIFAVASSKTGINLHSRYVLPCFPIAFIFLARLWANRFTYPFNETRPVRPVFVIVRNGMLLSAVLGSLASYPHSSSFFNMASGGLQEGSSHLLGSDVDWGQDLLLLQGYSELKSSKYEIYLATRAMYPVSAILPDWIHDWPSQLSIATVAAKPSLFIISTEMLREAVSGAKEKAQYATGRNRTSIPIEASWLRSLSKIEPIERIGATHVVYDSSQIQRLVGPKTTSTDSTLGFQGAK
jgi:hypothetical protein